MNIAGIQNLAPRMFPGEKASPKTTEPEKERKALVAKIIAELTGSETRDKTKTVRLIEWLGYLEEVAESDHSLDLGQDWADHEMAMMRIVNELGRRKEKDPQAINLLFRVLKKSKETGLTNAGAAAALALGEIGKDNLRPAVILIEIYKQFTWGKDGAWLHTAKDYRFFSSGIRGSKLENPYAKDLVEAKDFPCTIQGAIFQALKKIGVKEALEFLEENKAQLKKAIPDEPYFLKDKK